MPCPRVRVRPLYARIAGCARRQIGDASRHANCSLANAVDLSDYGGVRVVPRVLIVEDDAPIASMIADELAQMGFDVVTANNGGAALAELDTARPDAIVLDLMLP